MSAAPRYPGDIGYSGLRMTADQYLSLGETEDRYELIDGVVVMSPSPTPVHQLLLQELLLQLGLFARVHVGTRVFPDIDVRLSPTRVYRPDVSVYREGRFDRVPSRLNEPPDLAIEVLSAGSRPLDLITKRDDYDAFGVGEYWVIDPADASLRCWRRQRAGDESRLVEWLPSGSSIPSAALPGFMLQLAPLQAVARQVEQ